MTAQIIDLAARRREQSHRMRGVLCLSCGYGWVALVPAIQCEGLECPACGEYGGAAVYALQYSGSDIADFYAASDTDPPEPPDAA